MKEEGVDIALFRPEGCVAAAGLEKPFSKGALWTVLRRQPLHKLILAELKMCQMALTITQVSRIFLYNTREGRCRHFPCPETFVWLVLGWKGWERGFSQGQH